VTTGQKRRLTRFEQKAKTRQEILGAGEQVFRREGYHRASVEMIAAEAGYTKGAFYANFSSKEELFLTLVEPRLEERSRVVDKLRGSKDIHKDVTEFSREFMAYIAEEPDWQRAFLEFIVFASSEPHLRDRLEHAQRPLRHALASVAEDRWELSRADADIVATAVWAISIGAAIESLQSGWSLAAATLQLSLESILDRLDRQLHESSPARGGGHARHL